MAGFGIGGVERYSWATRELVSLVT
jgi:hypothetical protein